MLHFFKKKSSSDIDSFYLFTDKVSEFINNDSILLTRKKFSFKSNGLINETVFEDHYNEFINYATRHCFWKNAYEEFQETNNVYDYNIIFGLFKESFNKTYSDFINYLVEMDIFHEENIGLQYPLGQYPYAMRIEPFLNSIETEGFIITRKPTNYRLSFLLFIRELFSQRFIQINDIQKEEIKKELRKLVYDSNEQIRQQAQKIYDKVHTYKGVNTPDNLPFISVIKDALAKELSYVAKVIFVEGTDEKLIESILTHRVRIVKPEEKSTAYINHKRIAAPPVIEYGKRGYLSYFIRRLREERLLIADSIDKSIARHGLFQYKSNKGIVFPTAEQYYKSYSNSYGKWKRYNKIDEIQKRNPEFWKFTKQIDNIILEFMIPTA